MSAQKSEPDWRKGELAARLVLLEEGYEHLADVNLDDFAQLRGVTVRDLALTGCEGRLVRRGKTAILSVSSSINLPTRRRFVIAHELGHFELHEHLSNLDLVQCDAAVISQRYNLGPEKEANVFAAELLMPHAVWSKMVDVPEPSLEVVGRLANRFQVSLTAAAIRFCKLTNDRCCCVFVRNGIVNWVVPSNTFGYWIDDGVKALPQSLAHNFFRKRSVPDEPQFVASSAWLDKAESGLQEIQEDLRKIADDASLSLLWIPSEPRGEEDDG